ncbi:MAG: ribosome small subunit-dependent GTPase A [Clostridia bacterium]|nr:ribosome small subunit-dependent GTPase A [Clostridia bacterium]
MKKDRARKARTAGTTDTVMGKSISAPLEKEGMIVKGVGGLYTVRCDDGETVVCPARGLFRFENVTPLVGDRVLLRCEGGEESADRETPYSVESILPRKNSLIRPAIANLTHLFIVVPSAKPKPDLLTVDKMTAIAESCGIEPVIIVNKTDIDPEESRRIEGIYSGAGFACMALSAESGEGCGVLSDYFREKSTEGVMISAMAGASAAGKSTLLKRLFPELKLKTGEVSRKTERGRHTTRHVELFDVYEGSSCYIADTPGFSLLDFARFNFLELSELASDFREFRDCLGKCRYTKCTHTKEEGCAVLEKLRNGGISPDRHESYVALYAEIKSKPEWKRRKEMSQKA